MGKAGQSSKTYTGSFARCLGFGPADSLISIDDGQNIIWPMHRTQLVSSLRVNTTGAIYRNTAMDADGKTVLQTTVGTIRFYWGTATQNVDPALASLKLDQGLGVVAEVPMSPMKNVIYYVADNVKLGSSPAAPKLYFTFSRYPNALSLPAGVSRIGVIDGGAGYIATPTVQIDGDGTGAVAFARIKNGEVSEVTIREPGSGYTAATITFVGGLNTGPQVDATATATIQSGGLAKVHLTDGGQNYAEAPAVIITGDGTGATATAEIGDSGKVNKITILDSGRGYTSATVSFVGGFARAATASALQFHELNGDSILPEVIYDMFINKLYGLGIDPALLDVQTYVDAALQIISEDLGVSPYFDKSNTLRQMIGALNPYLDSFIYQLAGKIGFKLIRPTNLSDAVSMNEDDFTDELQPEYQGLDQTSSMTRLTFTDQTNQWQTDSEPYDNPVVSDVVGYSIENEVSAPFIIRREVAKRVVKRVGLKSGHAPVFYRGKALPKHSARKIGDVVLISYAKFGLVNVPARIMERTLGPATAPEVNLVFMLEQARSDSNDYVAPPDFLVTPALLTNELGKVVEWGFIPTQPRVMILPPDLKGNKKDGWLTAFNRQLSTDLKGNVWFTPDPAQTPYKKVLKSSDIPALGQVQSWHKCQDGTWIARVQFPAELDYDYFVDLMADNEEIYFVFGRHDVQLHGTPSDQQKITGFWASVVSGGYFRQLNDTTFDVQVSTGQFSWDDFALETNAAPAAGPGEVCYVATLDGFAIQTTNSTRFERTGPNGPQDTDLKRRVKVALINQKKTEPLDDTIEASFDVNDTTMSAQGTYAPDWGLKTMSTYEMYDRYAGEYFGNSSAFLFNLIADVDQALTRRLNGTPTNDDNIVYDSIDQVLGALFQRADSIYNVKP